MLAAHNTPFGDIVDTEDDLQPLVAQMFKDAARAVSLVAAAMAEATFDVEKLAERAGQNWITVTELADTLARDHGLPFKAGHTIAAQLIAGSRTSPGTPLATLLRQVSKDVTGKEIVYTDDAAGGDPQPAALRRGAEDLRRPVAVETAARDRRVEGASLRRDERVAARRARPRSLPRSDTARRAAARRCSQGDGLLGSSA